MKANILGVQVDDISQKTVLDRLILCISKKTKCVVVTPNAEIVLYSLKEDHYKFVLNAADISIPDGVGLKVGSIISGRLLKHRVPGIDTAYELCKEAAKKNYSIYLLGGKQYVSKIVAQELQKSIPGLRIVGYHHGGTVTEHGHGTHDSEIIEDINEKKPDIVFVAFGAPKQEYWMIRNKKKLNAYIFMGIGGSFDVFSKQIMRAPRFLRKTGLEWLFRFIQQPSRIFRIINAVVVFPLSVLFWWVRMTFFLRPNVAGFIMNRRKEVLIVSKKLMENHWQIPQGGIDMFEKIECAGKREMYEETGLSKLKILAVKKNFHKYTWDRLDFKLSMGYKGQKQNLIIFEYGGKNNDVVVDEAEIDDYKWVPIKNVIHEVHPVRKEMLKKVLHWYEKLVS